jgi:hypothetical protein
MDPQQENKPSKNIKSHEATSKSQIVKKAAKQ